MLYAVVVMAKLICVNMHFSTMKIKDVAVRRLLYSYNCRTYPSTKGLAGRTVRGKYQYLFTNGKRFVRTTQVVVRCVLFFFPMCIVGSKCLHTCIHTYIKLY